MIPQKTAFVFPGQGSQLVSMGHELALAYPTARLIFEEANDILGFNLSGLAWGGPEDELNDTLNTQPALLVHSAAVIRVFQELYPGFLPAYVAGHSMGQISALLVAGSLTFQQALLLARTRGRLMKHAGEVNPGGMAAILGLDIPKLEIICHEASLESEIVQVANDNCPGQVVISGASAALDRAVAAAQAAGARRAKRLAVSIAAHSPLMESIQDDLNQAVESSGLLDARIPVVGNVNASPLMLAWELCQDTQAQMTNRVRWTESIQYMERNGIETFVEMGSGSVLVGLIKRIASEATGIAVGTPPDFEKLAVI
jgi:[acyl-carrier-protein] S-malonyltransferase